MKRNIFLSVAAAIMLCVAVCAGAFWGISANAQTREENKLSDFAENFESYQTDAFIENVPSFAEKWENNVLRGGEAQGMDSHLKEAAKVRKRHRRKQGSRGEKHDGRRHVFLYRTGQRFSR